MLFEQVFSKKLQYLIVGFYNHKVKLPSKPGQNLKLYLLYDSLKCSFIIRLKLWKILHKYEDWNNRSSSSQQNQIIWKLCNDWDIFTSRKHIKSISEHDSCLSIAAMRQILVQAVKHIENFQNLISKIQTNGRQLKEMHFILVTFLRTVYLFRGTWATIQKSLMSVYLLVQ